MDRISIDRYLKRKLFKMENFDRQKVWGEILKPHVVPYVATTDNSFPYNV